MLLGLNSLWLTAYMVVMVVVLMLHLRLIIEAGLFTVRPATSQRLRRA